MTSWPHYTKRENGECLAIWKEIFGLVCP